MSKVISMEEFERETGGVMQRGKWGQEIFQIPVGKVMVVTKDELGKLKHGTNALSSAAHAVAKANPGRKYSVRKFGDAWYVIRKS